MDNMKTKPRCLLDAVPLLVVILLCWKTEDVVWSCCVRIMLTHSYTSDNRKKKQQQNQPTTITQTSTTPQKK